MSVSPAVAQGLAILVVKKHQLSAGNRTEPDVLYFYLLNLGTLGGVIREGFPEEVALSRGLEQKRGSCTDLLEEGLRQK